MHQFASLHIRFPRLWLTRAQEIFLFSSMKFCTLEHFKAGRLNASYSSSLTVFSVLHGDVEADRNGASLLFSRKISNTKQHSESEFYREPTAC